MSVRWNIAFCSVGGRAYSIRIYDDTEKIDVTLTFEKGCDFPSIPAGEKITDIEDFENVLPEELAGEINFPPIYPSFDDVSAAEVSYEIRK